MKLNGVEYTHMTALPKHRAPVPVIAFLPDGTGTKQQTHLFADCEERSLLCFYAFEETWEVFIDGNPTYIDSLVGYVSVEGRFQRAEDALPDFEKYSYHHYSNKKETTDENTDPVESPALE